MVFKFSLVLCTLVAMATLSTAGPTDVNEAEKEVAKSSQLFAGKVYSQLKNEPGNLLICPVSVQTVLALVQAGAKSGTSKEIQEVLFLPKDKTKTQYGYQSLMESLQKSQKVSMDIANRIFVKESYNLNENFKKIATESFKSGIEKINFNDPVASSGHINNWVEEITHNKIKELIKPSSITPFTRMVLVNALYFKGTWLKRFEEYMTREDDFFINLKESVKVQMMSLTDQFNYAENEELDCKFLELPYDGNEYAMTIILPNKKDGLAALENNIEKALAPQKYQYERVHVKLPQFEINTSIKFTDVLKNMGMTKSFSDEADFSGLLDSKETLSISEVIQKNFIKVTEDGTEAASATAVGVVTLSLPSAQPRIVPFVADHPYIFILRKRGSIVNSNQKYQKITQVQRNSDVVLFIGRYVQPQN